MDCSFMQESNMVVGDEKSDNWKKMGASDYRGEWYHNSLVSKGELMEQVGGGLGLKGQERS